MFYLHIHNFASQASPLIQLDSVSQLIKTLCKYWQLGVSSHKYLWGFWTLNTGLQVVTAPTPQLRSYTHVYSPAYSLTHYHYEILLHPLHLLHLFYHDFQNLVMNVTRTPCYLFFYQTSSITFYNMSLHLTAHASHSLLSSKLMTLL